MSDRRSCLLAILEAIEKIRRYSAPFDDDDDFFHHEMNFDAAMMQFIVIGEMVAKIDEGLKESSPQVPWQEIKGFRNIVAHDYFGIDSTEIWSIITTHLPNLEEQVKSLLDSLREG